MDFQFFFNDAEFTFNSIINVAGIETVLGNVGPDVLSGGFTEFRFTSLDIGSVFPNGTTLVFLRFNTASTIPCELNIVFNQFSVVKLGTLNAQGDVQATVVGCANPPAQAGPDQDVCDTQTTLQGNEPLIGAGTWSVISGSATIQDVNLPNTIVTGLSPGINTFRWTMPATSNSPVTFDDITVIRYELPSTSNAGENLVVCLADGILNAETPVIGSGIWEIVQGSAVFENETSPVSGVSGLSLGDNIFSWTVSNGSCPESVSQVIVFRKDSVFAGIDQTSCSDNITLEAEEPSEGTGLWTIVLGSGTFADATLFNTSVTDLAAGENIFQWTITGSNCPDSSDQVSIFIQCNNPPVITNDLAELLEDGEASGNILDSGDIDPDGTQLLVNTIPLSGPLNGSITIIADGSFTYVPDLNFFGLDTVVIEVCDQGLPLPALCGIDTLFISVLPVNDAPIVENEFIIVFAPTPFSGNVLVNDSDIENTVLSVNTSFIELPNHGTFTIDSTGAFTYEPNPGYIGFDTAVVWVCDSGFPLPEICVYDTIFIEVIDFSFNVSAGDDKQTCENLISLDGSEIPEGGIGLWSQISGSGLIVEPGNPLTEVQNLAAGENTFVWSVTLNNTTLSDTVIFTVNPPAEISFAGEDQVTCTSNATLSADAPVNDIGSWTLFSGEGEILSPDTAFSQVTELGLGSNTFVWTLSNGFCTSSDTVVITRIEQAFVNAGPDTAICADDFPIVLPISISGATEWKWTLIAGTGSVDDPTSTSPEFSGLDKTVNTFVLSAGVAPCESFDTLNITVYSDSDPFCLSQEVFIPTGFSPNGDGEFDLFEINNLNNLNAQVQIFNRWGTLVFEDPDYNNDWDGTSTSGEGGGVPDGTYYYVIQIEGEDEPRTGTLTIWR
jgi:gliding motility-associated-like protein